MTTNTRLLWLPVDSARPALCLHLDADGRLLSREEATPAAPLAASRVPCRVVIPGMDARALWRPLGARSQAQAIAVARALAAAELAGTGADLHVAVAPPGTTDATDPPRLVVLIDRVRLQYWLDRARAVGVEPAWITPDHLVLPAGDGDPATVLDRGSHWAVRAGCMAFAAEPELARQVLGDRPARPVPTGGQDEAMPAGGTPAIDLLGDGPSLDGTPAPERRVRRLAWLAAALALSPALLVGAQALRHAIATHLVQQHVQARVAGVLGLDAPPADPVAHTTRTLAALQAPDRFAGAADALFDAMAQVEGAALAELRFRDGTVEADLVHPDAADGERVLAALAAAGLDARVTDTRPAAPGVRSRLQLEVRP